MHSTTIQGYVDFQGFMLGEPVFNPYRRGTMAHRNWWYGWELGSNEEAERYNASLDALSKGPQKITENPDIEDTSFLGA